MKILSIQSSVAYGHVGNSAALFPLQLLGFEPIAVNSVAFSNHPGHGGFGGGICDVAPVLDGLDRLGVLGQCDGVLTGYAGSAANLRAALDAIAKVKPGATYLCDPVLGDDGRLYVAPGIPELMRHAVARAHMVTPNLFELGLLAGGGTVPDQARALLAQGPRLVAVTSVPDGADISVLAFTRDGAWKVATPRLDLQVNGAGDLFSALLLAHSLKGLAVPEALSLAVSGVFAVLERTSGELALVAARDQVISPSRLFPATPL